MSEARAAGGDTAGLARTLAIANAIGLIPTGIAVWFLFWPGPDGIDPLGYLWGRDFVNFWAGARLSTGGAAALLYDLSGYHAALQRMFWAGIPFLNFSYPPSILPLLAPLAMFPYPVAFALWSGLGLAACAWVTRAGLGRFDRAAVGLLLFSPVVAFDLVIGQASAFFTAMVVGGLFLRPSRPILAGILFGLAAVKPQLGTVLPFYLLWVGDRRAIGAAVVTALGFAALSWGVWGAAPWRGFLDVTLPYQMEIATHPGGFFSVLEFSPYVQARLLGLTPPAAWVVHLIPVVAGVVATLLLLRRGASPGFGMTMLAFGTVLVPPYALAYDLLLPAAALVVWAVRDEVRLPWWATAAVRLFWIAPPMMLLLGETVLRCGVFLVWPAAVALLVAEWQATGTRPRAAAPETTPSPDAA